MFVLTEEKDEIVECVLKESEDWRSVEVSCHVEVVLGRLSDANLTA